MKLVLLLIFVVIILFIGIKENFSINYCDNKKNYDEINEEYLRNTILDYTPMRFKPISF